MPTLIVIVNYGTPTLTIDCLRSLASEVESLPDTQVVVADNASPDESALEIPAAIQALGFSRWCHFVELPRNGGFAYGNNTAIVWADSQGDKWEACPADLVWLLNPDTLVLEGALVELERFMNLHPWVGIAGGCSVNSDGSARMSAFRFPTVKGELEAVLHFGPLSRLLRSSTTQSGNPQNAAKVDWVSGASMMVRRTLFDRLGMLDDAYFMYYEETDFCRRAAHAGVECWHVPQSRVIHLVGQSSGVTGAGRLTKRRPRYWFDSRRRYFRRHHGLAAYHLANVCWLLGYPVGLTWRAIRGKPRSEPPMLWWDFLRFNYLSQNDG